MIGTYKQSDYEKWENAEIISYFNPYENVGEPEFTAPFDAIVFVVPNYKKIIPKLICDALTLTDKPVCILKVRVSAYEDLEPIRKLPAERRARLYIGEQYRYLPGAMAITECINNNIFGKIESISWRTVLTYEHADWMDAYDHMIFEDLSYHHFTDLIIWFNELHGSVYADSYSPAWMKKDCKGFAGLIFKTDSGIHMTYDVRWGAAYTDTTFFGDVTIEGDKGLLKTDGNKSVFITRNGEEKQINGKYSRYNDWAGIINHFCDIVNLKIDSIGGERFLLFDEFDNALKLMYAGVCSSENNKIVYI